VTEASLTELQTALTSGSLTSVALVDAYLARIAAYDHAGPSINAIIRINAKAHADAIRLDGERRAGKVRGPLHGIPIVLKDNYDTGDMPTSAGSLALATSQPARDAFVVKRLRDAGAIVLAKANMHELAAGITSISSLGGQTRNPYDLGRCPGGSSGGTGAAVAASFAAVGWGSDTCGSIRIPSAFNNLFGLRPTQGMVSRTGIVPLSHTQDIGGPLARTATDLAIALDATIGVDSADAETLTQLAHAPSRFLASLDKNALRGARLGVFRNYFTDTDPEIADTIRAAIAVMRANGAEIVDVQVADFDSLMAGSSVINTETKFDLIDYLKTVPNAPVHSMREILDGGLYDRALESRFRTVDSAVTLDSDAHRRQLVKQAALRRRFDALLDSLNLDALVFPTVRQRPTRIGDVQLGSTCNLSAHTGLPALNVPAGFTADGLPVGLELLGRAFTDARLVALGYAFEQTGSRRRAPASAPPLVNGKAPSAIAFTTTMSDTANTVRATFRYDATLGALAWSATLAATSRGVQAVVLRRRGAQASPTGADVRVVTRLLGPDMHTASGTVMLNRVERLALRQGTLMMALYDGAHPTKPVSVPLVDVEKRLVRTPTVPSMP
jgi:Asp-tRNA(Asn)/Glu-tRNA(Gln) amidotransferase A subunit family amidase